MRRARWALAMALALGPPGTLTARAAEPAPDAMAAAKALNDAATVDYKAGRFADALRGYEQAYATFAAPGLLFNIGQCHLRLEAWDRAIFFFEGYLRELPAAKNRKLVEDLIAEAEDHRKLAMSAEELRLASERARLEAEQRARDEADARRRSPPPAPPSPPAYETWWFWTVVGGVALGGIAAAATLSRDTRSVLPSGSLGTWDRR